MRRDTPSHLFPRTSTPLTPPSGLLSPSRPNLSGPNGSHGKPAAPPPPVTSPALVEATLTSAHAQFEAGNLPAARDFLALLDHLSAHTSDTLLALGNIHYQLKEFQAANTAYGRAAALQPNDAGLQTLLARTSLRLDDVPSFERHLGRALELDAENWDALKLLADSNRQAGHWEDAAQIYGRLVHQNPNEVEILLALAKCFHQLGERDTAQECLARVVHLDPTNQLARENLAILSGDAPAHQVHGLAAGLAANPAPTPVPPVGPPPDPAPGAPGAPADLQVADEAYARGDLPAAAAAMERAVRQAPESLPLRLAMGNLQFQLHQYPQALESYVVADTLQPDTVDTLVRLAATALRCQDAGRFEQALSRALELEPTNGNALRVLADLNFQNRRFENAGLLYQRILEQSPRATDVWLSVGRCEFELGHWEQSRQAFAQALALEPDHALARENHKVVSEKIALEAAKAPRQTTRVNWNEVGAKLARLRLPTPPAA